jgi:hypothetical protein
MKSGIPDFFLFVKSILDEHMIKTETKIMKNQLLEFGNCHLTLGNVSFCSDSIIYLYWQCPTNVEFKIFTYDSIGIKQFKDLINHNIPLKREIYNKEWHIHHLQIFNKWIIPSIERYSMDKEMLIEEQNKKIEEEMAIQEQKRVEKLTGAQSSILQELDKDGNGEVDILEGNDFNTLLKKHQKKVIEIDRSYIQNFVKVANHLKTKKNNIQLEFSVIGKTKDKEELDVQYHLLKNQIHGYELLLFHSLNMIVSLSEDDMITFYEIYEAFDKMGIWNSNWENEVGEKLTDIGDGLTNLMYSINQMEQSLVNEIGNLAYVTEVGFEDLQSSVSEQLKEIDSSLMTNNLLTGIQTYQMYKINKNTKGIR